MANDNADDDHQPDILAVGDDVEHDDGGEPMSLLLGNLRDLIRELPAQSRDPEAGASRIPPGVHGSATGGRTSAAEESPALDDPDPTAPQ